MNLTHANQILFANSSTCWKAVKMLNNLVMRCKPLQNRRSINRNNDKIVFLVL